MKQRSGSQFAFPSGAPEDRIRQRKQPVQERSRTTVEAILNATLQVLVAGGATSLTTTRVAERAGVSVGTLYQYFPDKSSLIAALRVRYIELIVDRIADAARAMVGRPLESAVRRIVSAAISAKRENLQLTLALLDSMDHGEGERLLRDAMHRLVMDVQRMIESTAPGLPNPRVAASTLASAVEGVINSALHDAPATLQDPSFENELVALGVGYLRQRARWAASRQRATASNSSEK